MKCQPPQLDFMKSLAFTPLRTSVNYTSVRDTHSPRRFFRALRSGFLSSYGVDSSRRRFLPSREGGERGSGRGYPGGSNGHAFLWPVALARLACWTGRSRPHRRLCTAHAVLAATAYGMTCAQARMGLVHGSANAARAMERKRRLLLLLLPQHVLVLLLPSQLRVAGAQDHSRSSQLQAAQLRSARGRRSRRLHTSPLASERSC